MHARWILRTPDETTVHRLAAETRVSELLARLLVNRGVAEVEAVESYLEPKLRGLRSPFELAGMSEAVDRLIGALVDKEPIAIWGDYDVDGVTSTTQLVAFLRTIGADVRYFVPDRFVDGYGVSIPPLQRLAEDGVRVVVTVDCGIRDTVPIEFAKSAGMDVIVVDHHIPPEELPDAYAIINPLQEGCGYPFKYMAACGLTFHLLVAFRARLRARGWFDSGREEPDLRHYLDLAALGTVADVVPLKDTNRLMTSTGLKQLPHSRWPGLRALCQVSGLDLSKTSAGQLGFQLGPRINAAGRLGSASRAVDLLLTEDPDVAFSLAREVDSENSKRRTIEKSMFEAAKERVEARIESDGGEVPPAIVVGCESWHSGVAGIVASRLVEAFHRPSIVVAFEDGRGKGSARSVPGFDLVAALDTCADWLSGHGGHAHAAGLSVMESDFAAFEEAFCDRAARAWAERPPQRQIYVDGFVELESVTLDLANEIGQLAPFGSANPRPVFATKRARVREQRILKDQHLLMTLEMDGACRRAIGFRMADRAPGVGATVDIAFHAEENTFRGNTSVQLRLCDVRSSDGASADAGTRTADAGSVERVSDAIAQ